jgi:hypothetical protein
MRRPVDNSPTTCANGHAGAMSNVDGCPECVTNTEPPRSAVPVEGAWRCGYLCAACGHAWTTDWRD